MSDKKKQKPKKDVDLRTLPRDKRPDPTTGQSAPERTLAFDDLSSGEVKVVSALDKPGQGRREVKNVSELAKATRQTPLVTRNSIRRLVPSNWIERVTSVLNDEGEEVAVLGHYRITESGRKRLHAAVD